MDTRITELDNGLRVGLVANEADGWRFTRWTGDCSGVDACTVTMDGARNVTAVFVRAPATVRVTVSGRGSVTSRPGGIACPGTCGHTYPAGTTVTAIMTA